MIPVVVGEDADPDELEPIFPIITIIIKTNQTEKPTDLANRIMKKALSGKQKQHHEKNVYS